MSSEVQTIIATALSLPATDRALVAQTLLESLAEDVEVDAAWAREAEDRLAAYERGELQGFDFDEVMRDLRERKNTMKMVVLAPAKAELREAHDYYERQREGLGDDFLEAIDDAMRRVVAFPNAWTRLSGAVRRCRTNRFPYGVVYHVQDNAIIVLAVMHLKRRPGYWRDRLNLAE